MYDQIEIRAINEARYILATNSTVRSTALVFNVGKSTVHKDVTQRLRRIDRALYEKVRKVLEKNFQERHIRGGEATRLRYLKNKTFIS